jgi:CHAD domain-containing protein
MPRAQPYRRISRSSSTALSSLAALGAGDSRPKTLHRVRTELRRLQAFLDLIGETERSGRIADCVSSLSSLRTLQVFEKYLASVHAAKQDRRRVGRRVAKLLDKLRRKQVYRSVQAQVKTETTGLPPQSDDWMAARFRLLRDQQAEALADQLDMATARPRRRTLHALRLRIKAVRYQEELALLYPFGNPDVVSRLKAAQTVLGEYEERAEFRKLARDLRLSCRKRLKKDWRRARKRARLVPGELSDLPTALTDERILFLRPAKPSADRRLAARTRR